jgi:hypothetical protein
MSTRFNSAVALLGSILLAQVPQPPRFRVAVDAVRIDAVVTDTKNNVVRDLTPTDFEIFQDGKPQKVQFVPVSVAAASPGSRSSGVAETPRRGPTESVQRTFVILVDGAIVRRARSDRTAVS